MNYIFLSQKDVVVHRNVLKKFKKIDVSACIRIFERTFATELCPKCKDGYLLYNHITSYNKDIMRCSNCGHIISLDSQQS
ncbi:MAG: hypothetical protein BWY02_02602 [bacterium ADurb.Bin157]|nr:MAG: hypothetical protein BWY02_02602 [bacterium ADurb.Bin157]